LTAEACSCALDVRVILSSKSYQYPTVRQRMTRLLRHCIYEELLHCIYRKRHRQ